jgi:hypothetical protein
MVKGRLAVRRSDPDAPVKRGGQSVSGPAFVLRKTGLHRISSSPQDVANSTPRRTQLASLSCSGWGVFGAAHTYQRVHLVLIGYIFLIWKATLNVLFMRFFERSHTSLNGKIYVNYTLIF